MKKDMDRKILGHSKNFSILELPKKGMYMIFSEDTMRFFMIRKVHWDDFVKAVNGANRAISGGKSGGLSYSTQRDTAGDTKDT